MRKLSFPTLLAVVALVAAACSSSATPAPTAAPTAAPTTAPTTAPTAAPTTAPTAAPTAAPTEAPSVAPSSALKIGVVTDIGTVNDKGFNEYSYKGAQEGAAAIGAADPPVVVPKDQSEYAADIQNFVTQGYDVIVTVGFNMANAAQEAALANPNIQFVGVDQSACVDETGKVDPTFGCKGDAKTLLPNFHPFVFKEDQAGYLAGIVAASASKSGVIGAIGGTTLCAACVRYIQGYELGAKSVNPDIVVKSAYVTRDFSNAAFNDPAGGKSFAQNFIKTTKPDVLFAVAGKTGNGALDAACAAGIWAVGVDVDQYLSYPNASKCIVTSAEKKLVNAVSQSIQAIANGTAVPDLYDATNDGIGASPVTNVQLPDVQAKLDAAYAAMQAGTLETCPKTDCGVAPK
jgi:basic membrane protein A